MSTNQSNKEAWRKFLGIKDPSATLESGRVGGSIGRTAGRSGGGGGGGELDSDSVPEGEEEEGAEKGDGAADAGKQLKTGDKADRLEDLYDCETGEKVTIDGLGSEGTEAYPNGFDGCKDKTEVPPEGSPIYLTRLFKYNGSVSSGWVLSDSKTGFTVKRNTLYTSYISEGFGHIIGATPSECKSQLSDVLTVISNSGAPASAYSYNSSTQTQAGAVCLSSGPGVGAASFRANIETIQNPTLSQREEAARNENPAWPEADKNHLTWNKEKGCFEPLCPELNTQVSDKYKGCEDERILCDEDGNKVKVEIDGNTVKVTQEKYNQTAEIRNGKVTSVKALSESQTEAAFR